MVMFPVVAEIATALRLEKGTSSFGRLLFMSIAWGCIIGGIATFLGGARAPLAAGLLKEATGLHFSFMEWTTAACMIVLPMLTMVTDACGILMGWVANTLADPITLRLFLNNGMNGITFNDVVPPTLKTVVYGFIIGSVSCFQGMRTRGGTEGVGRSGRPAGRG